MGEGSIINRIVSMIKRGNRKFNTEFGSEGGPILKRDRAADRVHRREARGQRPGRVQQAGKIQEKE